MSVLDRTVAAARRIVGDASVDDVLAFLTIEVLRNEMSIDGQGRPPSGRTIASTFAASTASGGFDRSLLIRAMLERTISDMLAVARASTEGYLQAADTVRLGGGPEAVTAALGRDLERHEPGGDRATNARERIFGLFVATSDDEPALARQLRRFLPSYVEIFHPVVELYVKLFNRRLASGVTAEQLYSAIHCYLRGVNFYARCGTHFEDAIVSDTVLRLLWAHTTPLARPHRDPIEELWSGLNR